MTAPARQLDLIVDRHTRVVNIRDVPGWERDRRCVYVGRWKRGAELLDPREVPPGAPGSFGNPWNVREFPDALERFEAYADARLRSDPAWAAAVRRLRGRLLVCHCVSLDGSGPCHGKWFVRVVEGLDAADAARGGNF